MSRTIRMILEDDCGLFAIWHLTEEEFSKVVDVIYNTSEESIINENE